MGQDEDGKDMSQSASRVARFGDAAKVIASLAKKGDRVYVEGALTLNMWEGNDGETRNRDQHRRLEMRAPFQDRQNPPC